MKQYYENLDTLDNLFNWIRVVPLMIPEIQEKMGFDHAGMLETSLMLAAVPKRVNMNFLKKGGPWFTKEAHKARASYGKQVFKLIIEYLIEVSQ